jgi:Raf kinase inhibitor-like YbhB/YbcL family protein
MKKIAILLTIPIFLAACAPSPPDAPLSILNIDLTSPAFAGGETIPAEFTCDGDDISPELNWTDPPEGTQSFTLIMDDPDAPAGTWVHWVLYNLPSDARSLAHGYTPEAGAIVGNSSWNRQEYGGPCPPPPTGQHRYFFKLYALDITLDTGTALNKSELLEQMEGHVLAQGELIGVYERP